MAALMALRRSSTVGLLALPVVPNWNFLLILTAGAIADDSIQDRHKVRDHAVNFVETCKNRDDIRAGICVLFAQNARQEDGQSLRFFASMFVTGQWRWRGTHIQCIGVCRGDTRRGLTNSPREYILRLSLLEISHFEHHMGLGNYRTHLQA